MTVTTVQKKMNKRNVNAVLPANEFMNESGLRVLTFN